MTSISVRKKIINGIIQQHILQNSVKPIVLYGAFHRNFHHQNVDCVNTHQIKNIWYETSFTIRHIQPDRDKLLMNKNSSVCYLQFRGMAGHSKWQNIKHRKEAVDSKRSKLMGEKMLQLQAIIKTEGQTDPKLSKKLADFLDSVKKASLPMEKFEKAIKRFEQRGSNLTEHIYELKGQGDAALLLILEDDNPTTLRNTVKSAIKKLPVALLNPGKLKHMFNHRGVVVIKPDKPDTDFEEVAINCEAEEVLTEQDEEGNDEIKFICDASSLMKVKGILEKDGFQVTRFFDEYVPVGLITMSDEEMEQMEATVEKLQSLESYVNLYKNF